MDLSAEFAAVEGEGDGSLAFWRQAHTAYFTRQCERAGRTFSGGMAVTYVRFRVVWPGLRAGVEPVLRQAVRANVAGIQRVRHGVMQNRLTSRVIGDDEVVDAIERTGRGWVVEVGSQVAAFAVGIAVGRDTHLVRLNDKHDGRW